MRPGTSIPIPICPKATRGSYVKFRPEGVDSSLYFLALLDTGGLYCILNKDVTELVGNRLTNRLDRVALKTAHGLIRGDLYTLRITLVAEAGEPLDIESTAFISPDWHAPSVLGYTGLLERMRFAVDSPRSRWFFAPPK